MKKAYHFFMALSILLFTWTYTGLAHCDTMEGPVVGDAQKAIEQNNLNYVLKWIPKSNEGDVRAAFELAKKVRTLSTEARLLSDSYFFETVVRVHRIGEGVGFTGIKPVGTPIDDKIKIADNAILTGDFTHVSHVVPKNKIKEAKELFNKALFLKDFDVNNVDAGRKFVDAYVKFFHFVEGTHDVQYGTHKH